MSATEAPAAIWMAPSDLVPWKDNPREHDVEAIKASIQRFGFGNPILARQENNEIIAGHGRHQASIELDLAIVPVRLLDLSEEEAHALALADNEIAGDWDEEGLQKVLADLEMQSVNLDNIGFSEKKLNEILLQASGPSDEDDIPDPPETPRTKKGDIWILGDHRLLCGDCTKKDDIDRVLDGETVDVTITDPPYSVAYERSQKERGGSEKAHAPYNEGDNTSKTILGFMDHIQSAIVMTYPIDRNYEELSNAIIKNNFIFRKELVWAKDAFSFWPGSKYQQQHEPVLVLEKKGEPLYWEIPANQGTVLKFDRPRRHENHPTAKPMDLWEMLVRFHSKKGHAVYDPFLGSGTTLIASERLGRTCYGMEIEPIYCDVIVERWENLTGMKAKREKATG